MTIPCPIALASREMPDQPAVRVGESMFTYPELDAAIRTVAGALGSMGVGHGDRIGIRLGVGTDFPIVFWAVVRLGAVAVLVGDREPEAVADQRLRSTGCKLLISDAGALAGVPYLHPSAILEADREAAGENPSLDLEATASIVFTSGSEGSAKAVVQSLGNHWFSATGSQTVIPVSTSTRWAVMIPQYHVGGLSIFFRCFLHGGTAVVLDRGERTPSGLAANDVTHVSVVPTQLRDWLYDEHVGLLALLDTILVGGAPTPPRIRSAARERGLPVRFTYGSSEMSSQVATTDLDDDDARPGYAGRLLPHRQVRIENGEILVRGATRFQGYWKNGALITPFDSAGWFATGDMGWIDGDRLIVTGRVDNQFISGGENVSPEEIEEAIVGTGLAQIAVVVPVPDERFGSRPVAFIRPMSSPNVIKAGLREVVADFKVPIQIFPLPEGMDGSKQDRRNLILEAARIGSD